MMLKKGKIILYFMTDNEPLSLEQILERIYKVPQAVLAQPDKKHSLVIRLSAILAAFYREDKLVRFLTDGGKQYYYSLPQSGQAEGKKSSKKQIKNHVSIALVDDRPLFRSALKELLMSWGTINTVIEADTGDALLKSFRNTSHVPDICILSYPAPLFDNNKFLKVLKSRSAKVKVLVLAEHSNAYTIGRMMLDGAHGYMTVNCKPDVLKKAVAALLDNKYHWERKTTHQPLDSQPDMEKTLTEKEMSFLSLCAKGLSYGQIAKELGVSTRTAESYRDILFSVFKVNNRASLDLFAIQAGLVRVK